MYCMEKEDFCKFFCGESGNAYVLLVQEVFLRVLLFGIIILGYMGYFFVNVTFFCLENR